jgi:hypothetical protein
MNSILAQGSLPFRHGLVLALASFLLFVEAARSDLIITAQSTTVAVNSNGDSFDVTLTNNGASPVTIGGFAFGITTSAPLAFTDATTGTTATYIFAGNSLFGPDIVIPGSDPGQSLTLPGQSLQASDVYALIPASGATVAAGSTVGLGHVLFNAGSLPVNFDITFVPDQTSLSDQNGIPVNVDAMVGGTITVTPNVVVPEPSTLLLCSLACAGFVLAGRRKLRRS